MREWCFRSFHGQKTQNHHSRASLGWCRAPKPEKGPGKGRLAGGVREWCFRSFRGQKAQNHHSRASLGWCKAPKPEKGPGKERLAGGVREWCFRSFRGQKAQNHHSPARLWAGIGLRSLHRGLERLAGGVREWCFQSFRGQKAQNHHSHASLGWYRAPKPEKGPGKGGLRVACGSFRGQKTQNHHSHASLGWYRAPKLEKGPGKGLAGGVREWCFWSFRRQKARAGVGLRSLKKALERRGLRVACGSGVFGVFRASKPEKGPGKERLAGGVREWCFRSFRGQKAQNHHSRASLGWCRALERGGLRVACGSGAFGVLAARKLKITTPARFWAGVGLRSLKKALERGGLRWRAGVVFSEFSRPESSKSPLLRVSALV